MNEDSNELRFFKMLRLNTGGDKVDLSQAEMTDSKDTDKTRTKSDVIFFV